MEPKYKIDEMSLDNKVHARKYYESIDSGLKPENGTWNDFRKRKSMQTGAIDIVSPEFDILSLAPILKSITLAKKASEKVITNSIVKKEYKLALDDLATSGDLVNDSYVVKDQVKRYINNKDVIATANRNDAVVTRGRNRFLKENFNAETAEEADMAIRKLVEFDNKFTKMPFVKNSTGAFERAIKTNELRSSWINQPFKTKYEVLDGPIQGQYSRGEISLNWNNRNVPKVSGEIHRRGTLFHEIGHHARIGNTPMEEYKASRLLKDNVDLVKLANKNRSLSSFDGSHYLSETGEAQMNILDLARDMRIGVGDKYPGFREFSKSINNYKGGKEFVVDALRTSTKRDYKRIFDAMTGKYVVVPAIPTGLSIPEIKKK